MSLKLLKAKELWNQEDNEGFEGNSSGTYDEFSR
jgi:hypothetical protein